MFLIRPNVLSKICLKNHLLYITKRNGSHWMKDNLPGKHPKTPEECAAAAAKYNITPEEYKPYPEDFGVGDYPDLPLLSAEERDEDYPYDIPAFKRNYNDPIPYDELDVQQHRYNADYKHRTPIIIQTLQFLGTMLGFYILYHTFGKCKQFLAVAEKQYPKPGVVHYTFELEE